MIILVISYWIEIPCEGMLKHFIGNHDGLGLVWEGLVIHYDCFVGKHNQHDSFDIESPKEYQC